jgi:hypothetical protein
MIDFKDMETDREHSPRTSPGDMKEFIAGHIHDDFLSELAVRIESLRHYLEEAKGNQYIETQGAVKFARQMVSGIFEDLYHNALTDSEQGEN